MRHGAGFSLIELVLVIALIIIIVTLAMPQMSFLNKQIVASEVEKLATVCLYLRQLALVTQRNQTLMIDQLTNTYRSEECTYALSSGVRFGFLPNTYGPPSNPQSLIVKGVTFSNEKIVFHADGSISSGTLYLVDSLATYFYALTTPSGQAPCIRQYEYQQRWVLVS